jgi:hypothetical protein
MSKRFWDRLQSASEISLLVGCVLVVLGLVFEDWIRSLFGIGEVAVVVGVMVEGLADGGIFLASGKLQMIQEMELECMQLETAQANARAAEANQKAQEAVLELARLTAPRALTQEQRGRIVDKLKQYSGTEYDITVSTSDPEILGFVFTIELVLSTAGWTELDWKGNGEGLVRSEGERIIRDGVSVTNVVIGVLTEQPPKLCGFAQALADALADEGVDAITQRHTRHAQSSTNANAIHIMIGRKT